MGLFSSSSSSSSLPFLLANLVQCSFAILVASIQYGKRVLGADSWMNSEPSSLASSSFSRRVLHPQEIIFDATSRQALDTLKEYYPLLQQEQEQSAAMAMENDAGCRSTKQQQSKQQRYLDEPDVEAPPPPVFDHETTESSSSSSWSDSESSSRDEMTTTSRHPQHPQEPISLFRTRIDNQPFLNSSHTRVEQSLEILQSAGNADRLTLTCTGYKGGLLEHQINQDRATIVYPLLEQPQPQHDDDNDDDNDDEADQQRQQQTFGETLLMGVLDGHGGRGHDCAEFCRNELEHEIYQQMMRLVDDETPLERLSPPTVARHLEQILERVDAKLPRLVGRDGGTTCSLVLQLGEWVYLINTGDSQSILGAFIRDRSQESLVLRVTERHVPTLPSEVQRIQRAGGLISPDHQYVIYRHVDEDHGLAMTRSLGDHMAPGVIPTPHVTFVSKHALVEQALQSSSRHCLEAKDVSLFAISASDGILDVLHADDRLGTTQLSAGTTELARVVGEAFFGELRRRQHPLVAIKCFMDECATRWYQDSDGSYRDDIVIAASKLQ
mmetsp:Transcript_3314/g.6916  ORF Transcript_3314/g.6916 Transcript_3314/m.6916 type:complete len:553 (-) Transcript_3314:102-1760(-)